MNPLRLALSLVLLVPVGRTFAQQPTTKQKPSLCRFDSLPTAIQHRLKQEYGSWRVQEVADLSQQAHARWESEKPLECPGIAAGHFENTQRLSYALLLVPLPNADAGYRFLVFSQRRGQSDYDAEVLDKWDEAGAANYFLRGKPVGKFFDEASKTRFHANSSEGILLFDSAEKEYEVDVYYWSDGHYKHDPVDY